MAQWDITKEMPPNKSHFANNLIIVSAPIIRLVQMRISYIGKSAERWGFLEQKYIARPICSVAYIYAHAPAKQIR